MIHPRVKKRSASLIAGTWMCLIAVICAAVTTAPCDKSRRIFTESSGIITDGPSGYNYTQDSHCEWLIKAQNNSQFITLKFRSMGTECSYDYVFVYDGYSFLSPLLGSFSGKTEPQQITATSGNMLILLYSDTNYVLDGFKAEFSVDNCPNNCSDRGACASHTCVCEGDWGGNDCSVELCPQSCSGHGVCRGGRCQCHKGFSGVACSLDALDFVGNKWHWLSHTRGGLSPRAAHSAIYINHTDSLYVFGGYDLNKVLGSLQIYRFSTSQWEDDAGNIIQGFPTNELDESILREVLKSDVRDRWGLNKTTFFNQLLSSYVRLGRSPEINYDVIKEISNPYPIMSTPDNLDSFVKPQNATRRDKPSPRYGHSACQIGETFTLYGGKLDNGSLSSELWSYNVITKKWSLLAENSEITPPALTRHTLTAVNDEIYLFGGSTRDGEFSSRMFRIKLSSSESEGWQEVVVRGGKELDVRVVAHSAVYHSFSHSIIVYGGVVAGVARFSKLSDRMFAFDLDSKHWSELHYPRAHLRDTYVPRERAFHTATIIGNYLVIFGGYSHRHNKEEICYDNQMYMYHLGCHAWTSGEVLGGTAGGLGYPKAQGVFAHAAALRPPSTLLLAGGYHGNVNGDLLAFVIPGWLGGVRGADPEAACPRHKTHAECLADPECGWCSADEVCYGRTVGSNCTTNLQSVRCGGICPALGDCHACLTHGAPEGTLDRAERPPLPSVSTKLGLHHCTWCVQNARCHHKDDNYGVCGEDTPSQSPGWWGATGTEVTRPEQCRSQDKRPGLTFIKYQHPANWSHPDHVIIINATTVDFTAASGTGRADQVEGEMVARLRGFLHTPASWAGGGELLRVCAGHSRAELVLGENRLAANLSADLSQCTAADWPPLVPGRLPVDFHAHKTISSGPFSTHQQSKMELQHNKSNENAKVFTFEFLEPYSNGSCGQYDNCLHCLTDSECGWCELKESCMSRSENETQNCSLNGDWRYLTLQPSSCPNCSNYISCSGCVASDGCEWWAEDARCGRRGRVVGAVKQFEECPQPCHTRSDCSTCLDERGRCVWCEATRQCFSFSVYTSEYQFGLCREWLDRTVSPGAPIDSPEAPPRRADQCKSCSQHANCSSCLKSLSCGWCYSGENPIKGACMEGDFGNPHSNCGQLLNISSEESKWAYAQCPDVDECGLGLHDCHKEADCTNTHGSYSCKCRRGFIGDGRTACTQTCFNNCVHGYCLGAPEYICQCDLGWTGADCANNCGCNNHSTCHVGVGNCDECQDWTEGEFCDKCKVGSYGNATSSKGCRRCDCNGHGDESLGVCDLTSGECFCRDNTEGSNCEKCSGDYYGDPRHGGRCYYQCEARGMLTDEIEQGLGSHEAHSAPWGGPPVKECLWIISPGNMTVDGLIQLTINSTRLNVSCGDNAVYVYDGLPDLGGAQQSQLIGVFCSDASPVTVEARSGHLTVHYKQGPVGQGFEAVYKILSCSEGCELPRVCKNNHCVCADGFSGINCERELCPKNCSAAFKQGTCDKGYGRCLCTSGWGGHDCSDKLLPHQLVFTELFNSQHLADTLDHLRKTLPRFGHSLVADKRGSLWMFGGYSLSHGPLNDIRLFDTKNSTWMQVTVEATPDAKMPEGRYFHAAEIMHVRQLIYIYGGLSVQGKDIQNKTLGDFWQFGVKDQRWSNILGDEPQPPSLAGHTLTLQKHQDSESLVLIGGFSLEYGFLQDIWEFDLEKNKWEKLNTKGTKPIGICGHTTVYHAPSQSLYVFGGYLYSSNGTEVSNKLFALHYPTLQWSELPTFAELNNPADNLPRARFLHSAITTDDYMIVFGGRTYPHNATDSLSAYVYNCNQWIRLIKDVVVIGELPPPTYAHAMTLDAESGALYVVGGWDGGAHCQVTRITLPSDLCRLWSGGKHACRHHMGCSFCAVYPLGGFNSTHCHSIGKSDLCNSHNGTLITNNGASCDDALIAGRSCSNFTSCSTCLASWPAHPEELSICQWCSTCGKGVCIPSGHNCSNSITAKCDTPHTVISNVDSCFENKCAASDCDRCPREHCLWTRQVLLSNEYGPKVSVESIYDWTCVSKVGFLGRGGLKITESNTCPIRCHNHSDCRTCLQTEGAEGGSRECRWATHLNQCVAPSYQPLYCAGGVCGLVLRPEEVEQCPSPCFSFTQCAECLRHAHCGWCGKEGGQGDGICTEGSLDSPAEHPLHSTCTALYAEHHQLDVDFNDTISWHYVRCPPENECENGHHSCDAVSERCEDIPLGYECLCGPGHRAAGGSCVPVCTQGCVRGACIRPDICDCDFGYVGANCSIQCQCNGHAKCEGPDKLNQCLECHNNTMGAQCEKCKPLFVGDPTDNGQCVPCISYCNGHSSICLSDAAEIPMITAEMSSSQIESYLGEGPTSKAKCLRCANNTDGLRCDKCIDGNFRGSEDFRDACRPCECHGHGDICDPVTGEKCNCGNNTESDATCQTSSSSKNSAQECWRYQCVKCKDSYMGDPKNGHQCYKMMTADNKMCFDAKLIDECKVKPRLLNPGQTVFFVVIPRFMNVDIRVIIDVTEGELDIFMSPNDSAFVVSVNSSTGAHHVDVDPSLKSDNSLKEDIHSFFGNDEAEDISNSYNLNLVDGGTQYNLIKYLADNLSTFITVNKKNTLLRVRGLKNRLVLTLPQVVHDLGYTKFYLLLRAVHNDDGPPRPSKGMVFFRQDQLHIDLFVFFSVFFSCFFLFLAACVVAWKAKQAADVRRARRRHVVEMLHMAKRPFASVTLLLGPQSPPAQRRRARTKQCVASAEVCPVAIEPTEDGLAAVTSVFVRLPGGRSAPARLALASSLVLLARQLPSSGRTFLRRRSVHYPAAPPS